MKRFLLVLFALFSFSAGHAGTVELFSGETYQGRLEFKNGALNVTPSGAGAVRLDLTNVLDAVFDKSTSPEAANFPTGVLLTNGSYIAGNVDRLEDTTFRIGRQKISVALNTVAWLVLTTWPRDKVLRGLPGRTGALLKDGDFFEGTFAGISGGRVTIASPLFGAQHLRLWERVSVIVLRDAAGAPSSYEVSARDGSEYAVNDLKILPDGVLLHDSLAGDIKVPNNDILEIRAGKSRCQPLTGVDPFQVNAPAGMDPHAAVQVAPASDTEPASLLTALNAAVGYSIPAGLSVFSSQVAAPKDAPAGTRLSFALYADGRFLFRTSPMSAGDNPQPVRLSLGLARTVTLRVEPVGTAAAPPAGKWIEPVLLRP